MQNSSVNNPGTESRLLAMNEDYSWLEDAVDYWLSRAAFCEAKGSQNEMEVFFELAVTTQVLIDAG